MMMVSEFILQSRGFDVNPAAFGTVKLLGKWV
jgi:hypothetical protein